MVKERAGRPYVSLYDFCKRMRGNELNRRAVECIIKAGAFDCMGATRRSQVEAVEGILKSVENDARRNLDGQLDLFAVLSGGAGEAASDGYELKPLPEYPHTELLRMEKEVSGPVSVRPPSGRLPGAVGQVRLPHHQDADRGGRSQAGQHPCADRLHCSQEPDDDHQEQHPDGLYQREDLTGTLEVIVFPKVLETFRDALQDNAVVVIDGRLSVREDEPAKLMAETIIPIERYNPAGPAGL